MNSFTLPPDALAALNRIQPTLRCGPAVKLARRQARLAAFDQSVREGRGQRRHWRPNAI